MFDLRRLSFTPPPVFICHLGMADRNSNTVSSGHPFANTGMLKAQKSKLDPRYKVGVYLGVATRTGEAIMWSADGLETTRSIRRRIQTHIMV